MFTLFVVTVVGLCAGSFLNATAYRLVHGGDWFAGRSRCPRCGHVLAWYELIPLVSFLVQGGKCRSCRESIAWRYPASELICGSGAALLWLRLNPTNPAAFVYFLFFAAMCAIVFLLALYDGETREAHLPALALLGAVGIAFQIWILRTAPFQYDFSDILGYMVPNPPFLLRTLVVFIFFFVFARVASFLFRKESFGFGDVLLFTLLALFFTVSELFLVVAFAAFLGSFAGILFIARDRARGVATTRTNGLPFIPFIFAGVFTTITVGASIVHWYMRIFLS